MWKVPKRDERKLSELLDSKLAFERLGCEISHKRRKGNGETKIALASLHHSVNASLESMLTFGCWFMHAAIAFKIVIRV